MSQQNILFLAEQLLKMDTCKQMSQQVLNVSTKYHVFGRRTFKTDTCKQMSQQCLKSLNKKCHVFSRRTFKDGYLQTNISTKYHVLAEQL